MKIEENRKSPTTSYTRRGSLAAYKRGGIQTINTKVFKTKQKGK